MADRQNGDGAWLTFKCEDSPVEPRFEAFLHGLSILTGRWLKPICLSIYEGDRQTTRMLNRLHELHELDAEKLLAPIGTQREFMEDAHLFLKRFVEKAEDEKEAREGSCDLAHRYWHRILRARENDIENSSLVLSVAVEGLVKKTLLSEKDVDSEFVKQAEEAEHILENLMLGSRALSAVKSILGNVKTLLSEKDVDSEFVKQAEEAEHILENLTLGSRALSAVKSSLGNAKQPRVQDTLRRLATAGVISKAHLKAWGKLRHAAAHGSVLEDDDKALQEHLDRFHVCLDLYYRLVFLLIGYEGRHTDYGTKGWPTHAFRLGGEITATAPTTNEPVIPPESRPEDVEREAV